MITDYFNYAVPMQERMTAVSLFAGVGGFDLALERNGVEVVASAEIDKHARAILAKQFPNQKQFDDVRKVNAKELRDAGFIPERGIITGGFPCQDLSVAGKRAGLAGARSGLFYEIARIADETKAKWLVLENVPGLLTSQRGADMGAVVGTLVDLGYGVAWRVLDAQHFGVPQRRRRVFIVAERAGNPTGPAKVLFEPTSLRGDSSSSGASGQETTGDAGQGIESAISLYEPHHGDGRETIDRANTLNARMGTGGNNLPVLVEPIPIHDQATRFAGKRGELSDGKGNGLGVGNPGDPMNTLTQGDRHAVFVEPTVFVKSKRAQSDQDDETWKENGPHPTVNQFDVGDSRTVAAVIDSMLANGKEITGTIPASLYHDGTVVNQDADSGMMVIESDVPALVTMREGVTGSDGRGPLVKYDQSLTLATGNNQTLFHNHSVRRLTPTECERLQGFPDGWTEGQADSHRYKQMGNAVAVPVVEWVIQGIMEVGR